MVPYLSLRLFYTDIVSWNTILSGFRTSEGALSFALRMNFNGVVFYPVTYTTILAFCADHEDFRFGLQLHSLIFKSGLDGEVFIHGLTIKSRYGSHGSVCNVLISTYSKCEVTEDAKLVFQCMNDCYVVYWTTMISIDKEDAISLFNEMRLDGVYPNDLTFVGLISGMSIRKLVEEGEMIHGFCIKTGFLSKHDVCNSLITMYAKFGSMPDSIKVFEEFNCREIISWNALISGYAQNELCQDALKTFLVATMESKPNNYTFGSVLSAIDNDSVIELFKEMEREGVRPDSVTFLSILTACSRNGMVEMSRHLFHSMVKDYHIEPSPQHYSSMVDMLGHAGKLEEAEELMSQIPRQPGFSLLQSLLGACRIHGNVEMAERVADTLMRLEPMESGSFLLMSNLYTEKGDWEMVAKVGKWLRDKGVRKEVGYSWVDTGDADGSLYLHGFSSGDTFHPQSGEICRMAKCLGLEMKILRENMWETKSLKMDSFSRPSL
ncbi:hypothetical protein ACE6H2_000180 [Prunus campanulata]